ncbi:MAG: phage head closure protein [Syntrophomonas sp.]
MRQDKVIQLITITAPTTDDDAIPVEVKTYRTVFAAKKSVRSQEFYQAAAMQLRPSIVFEVYSREYKGEEFLRYDGKEYSIIRTYDKNGERIELVCALMPG